jgi:hypothetical protein
LAICVGYYKLLFLESYAWSSSSLLLLPGVVSEFHSRDSHFISRVGDGLGYPEVFRVFAEPVQADVLVCQIRPLPHRSTSVHFVATSYVPTIQRYAELKVSLNTLIK